MSFAVASAYVRRGRGRQGTRGAVAAGRRRSWLQLQLQLQLHFLLTDRARARENVTTTQIQG